jgi:hypothetical protein
MALSFGSGLPGVLLLPLRLPTKGRLESVHEVVSALESDQSHLNRAAQDMAGELAAMHEASRGSATTCSA